MWGFPCRLFVFVTLKLKWLRPASWSRGSSLVTTQGQWFSNFFVFSSVEPTHWGKPTRDIMIELELCASGVKIKGVSSWVRPAWVQFTDHTDIGHIFDTAENGRKQFWIKSRYLGVTSKGGDRANKCEIAIIDIISESQSASMQLRYSLCNLFFHFIISS